MKKSLIALGLMSAAASPVSAQNAMTLYGIIDAGITFTNNAGGHQFWQVQSGVAQGSRWGIKGAEDLGQGVRAIFQLESGFNVDTGKLGQGGLIFGRQAYVGLSDSKYGTVTVGRQYDPVADLVQPAVMNGSSGAFFSHAGDIDNSNNGFRVSNAVKYVTAPLGGLTFEALYAFGEQAGNYRGNSTVGAGASYGSGPVYLGAAYFYARNPATQFPDGNWAPNTTNPGVSGRGPFGYVGNPSNMETYAAGGTYSFGQAGLIGMDFSHVSFDDANGVTGNTVKFDNYEIWGRYYFTPVLQTTLGYTFTRAKVDATGGSPKYHQLNALLDYYFSKRTDVYLMGIYQQSAGGARADVYDGATGSQSSTTRQVVARVGVRHKF